MRLHLPTRCAEIGLAVALACAMGGCALKNPPTAADLQKDVLTRSDLPPTYKAEGGVPGAVASRWLGTFNDPALSAFVDEALRFNADLQAAAARVEQAGGMVRVASGSLLPEVSLAGTGSGSSSSSSGLNGLWLNASLELDIWGRVRYGQAAAQQQAAAAEATYTYARQSVAATVAKSYFLAIEAGQQVAIAQDMISSAEALLRLAQDRLRIGNGTEQEVASARANVGSYRDAQRQVAMARAQALRALELLLGRYPGAQVAMVQNLSAMPPPVPVGLPSELLERRPDVVAAERQVAAAFNRVGEAQAARLPRISLTAGVSSISSDVLVLQDRDNPAWGFGANLMAPIFTGGSLRAQVDIRTAEQKQAVAVYASAGQRAFSEVEGALSAEFFLRERELILASTVTDSERALELTRIQFRVGATDQRTVEQRQLSLFAARNALLRVRTERLAQRVNLHLALGGSFGEPEAVATR